jgi:hypothetical protein
MGILIYDNKKIIPAPSISINKNYVRAGGDQGDIISSNYEIVLTGTLLSYKGSPNAEGTFWENSGYPPDDVLLQENKLKALNNKQQALEFLFRRDNEGKALEIQSDDGSEPLKMYPQIRSLSFPDNIRNNILPYTIVLSADRIYPLNPQDPIDFNIVSASETWNLEPQETPEVYSLDTNNTSSSYYYRLTHSLTAQGARVYDEDTGLLLKEPWQWAVDWAATKLGNETIVQSGINNLPTYFTGKDHFRSENIDKAGGQYSLTETWILTSGNYIEDFTVSKSTDIGDTYQSITVQGNIRGLEVKSSGFDLISTRYQNASEHFTTLTDEGQLFRRAQIAFGNLPLHSQPTSTSVSKNAANGVINYDYQYNTRPSGLINGASSEVINVSYTDGGDAFASVFAIGRTDGPVLQNLSTAAAKTKSLSIEAVVDQGLDPNDISGSFQFPESYVSDIVTALDPINEGASESYASPAQKNWNPATGQLSYSVTWTYE